MEITKELLVKMLGTVEDFSAEAVKEQLAIRNKAASALLTKFRKAQGIAVKTKGE